MKRMGAWAGVNWIKISIAIEGRVGQQNILPTILLAFALPYTFFFSL